MSLLHLREAIFDSVETEDVTALIPGFDVQLTISQAQALLLVIGELCANSLKHGALRHDGGVEVSLRRTEGGFAMDWVESCSVPT